MAGRVLLLLVTLCLASPAQLKAEKVTVTINGVGRVSQLEGQIRVLLKVKSGTKSARQLQEGAEVQQASTPAQKPLADVAVVLVGQLRQFEATAPSIAKWVLGVGERGEIPGNPYDVPDLFMVAPLDENTYKLAALKHYASVAASKGRFVSLAVFNDFNLNSSVYPSRVIQGLNNGAQGLLQQFHMEEVALERVRQHEQARGRPYKWVMKTRPDTYWSAHPPALPLMAAALHGFNATSAVGNPQLTQQMLQEFLRQNGGEFKDEAEGVVVPWGQDWFGYNDRLAIGTSSAMGPTFERLRLLWKSLAAFREYCKDPRGLCYRHKLEQVWKPSQLNAETQLRLILEKMHKTSVVRLSFPFCMLSRRKRRQIPTFEIMDPWEGGEYCKPCRTSEAGARPDSSRQRWCKTADAWEDDWEALFDAGAGPDIAKGRRDVASLTEQQCLEVLQTMMNAVSSTGDYNAPPPGVICARRKLGKVKNLGYAGAPHNIWPVSLHALQSSCAAKPCATYALLDTPPGERQAAKFLTWEPILQSALAAKAKAEAEARAVATGAAPKDNAILQLPTIHVFTPEPKTSVYRRLMATARAIQLGINASAGEVLREGADGQAGGASAAAPKAEDDQAAESVMNSFSIAERMGGTAFNIQSLMAGNSHSKLALLKIDRHVDNQVRSWWAQGVAPQTCQLLLGVGSRETSTLFGKGWSDFRSFISCQEGRKELGGQREAKQRMGPCSGPLSWESLVGMLQDLGFELDRCTSTDDEKHGRCLFFSMSNCS